VRPTVVLVPLTALAAGLLFATSASTAQGTDLRADRRLQLTELIARERGGVARLEREAERLRAEVENSVDVELVSALPVQPEQRAALVASLEQRFGRRVRMREVLDDSLVGGALIRSGDLVIDGSLKGRLERLEAQISRQ